MDSKENKKDVRTDNASNPIQQQIKVSTHAQDSSPPRALSTAPLQTVASDTVPRLKNKEQRGKAINSILIRIALVLTAAGTALWVLNATGIIQGPWANLFGPTVASGGIIVSLIELSLKLAAIPATPILIVPLAPDTQPLNSVDKGFSVPYPNGEEGVLLAYAKRSLRGFNVDLFHGFGESTPYAAQNIVERKIGDHKYYIAIFQSLPPGPYTAHVYKKELIARITINRGQFTMIDWR